MGRSFSPIWHLLVVILAREKNSILSKELHFPDDGEANKRKRGRHSMVLLGARQEDAEGNWFFLFENNSHDRIQFFEADYDCVVRSKGSGSSTFTKETSGNEIRPLLMWTCPIMSVKVVIGLCFITLLQLWTRVRVGIPQQALPSYEEEANLYYNRSRIESLVPWRPTIIKGEFRKGQRTTGVYYLLT